MLPSELKNIDNIQSFTDLHKISLSLEKYKRADQSKSGKDRERFQDIDSNINNCEPIINTIPNSSCSNYK